MKNIRITQGTYGSRPGDGSRVVPIDRGQCCELPDEEADRLVSLGVAEYANAEAVATGHSEEDDGGTGTNIPDDTEPPNNLPAVVLPGSAEGLDIEDGHFTKESLSKMTNANLEKLATDLGLDAGKCRKKDDFVALLLTVELDGVDADEEADDDGEQPPMPPDDTIIQ